MEVRFKKTITFTTEDGWNIHFHKLPSQGDKGCMPGYSHKVIIQKQAVFGGGGTDTKIDWLELGLYINENTAAHFYAKHVIEGA